MLDPTPLPEWLTRREAAALLRISLATLHRMIRAGVLQPYKLLGSIRFRRSDLLAAYRPISK
jgi:excisionase family DNA binding protein